jgi:Ni/Co efflux regulator RcnB
MRGNPPPGEGWKGGPPPVNNRWKVEQGRPRPGRREEHSWNRGWDNWSGNWNRGWNRDHRYDWRGWRDRYRDRFNLGHYHAPSGWYWGYRRFSIGMFLDFMLFSPTYWIEDPYYYRLPPVYGPYRWVRYYDDALLVDIRTGYVVDVIHDVFW